GSAFDTNGRRVAERFIRTLGSPQIYTATTIDTPCKPLVMELMTGHPGLVPLLDWDRAHFAILFGTNPVVSHGHSNPFPDPVTRLRKIARDGELWVIDPRRTETARLATRHLAPRPGTDHILLAYLVNQLLHEGADRPYLAAHATGVDALAAAVAPFDLASSAERCGLPETDLSDLLAAIRRHGSASAQTGTGVTMSAGANVAEWLVWALNIVTHSYDRPGAMWFNPGYLRRLDTRKWNPGSGEPGVGPASRPDLPGRFGEFPCAALADEIEAGNLRALFVVGGNPVTSFPDTDRTRAALERLEVLAVCDIVDSETTAMASHVFACADSLERADLPQYIDPHLPMVATQYTPAVVAPVADRRPLWWPFAQLGRRLGLDLLRGMDPDTCGDDDLLRGVTSRGHLTFDELRAADGPVVADDAVFGWVERMLPEGVWRLAPAPLVEQLATLTDPPSLVLVPRRQPRHVNSAIDDSDDETRVKKRDQPLIELHPLDAAEAGIADGTVVRVTSRAGSLVGVARVGDIIRRGAVSIPHGYAAPNVSALTSGEWDTDPLTGMVLQSGVAVTLEPVTPEKSILDTAEEGR
ncbi:MAG TPA: molybdopterin dinucleotide binding domain-containing protein, partial [Acidimicrobiales bacterium]|nr:molybdopterin dinucleotide binding domain-containing protein [Acidimicrobiales bacterium]